MATSSTYHFDTSRLMNLPPFYRDILPNCNLIAFVLRRCYVVSTWHDISVQFCQLAVSIDCYFFTMSFDQFVIMSTCNFVNLSFHQLANLIYELAISSTCHFANLQFQQLVFVVNCHFYSLIFHQLTFYCITTSSTSHCMASS
jgi:hypothetical protein